MEITPLRLQVYVAQLRYYAHVYRMDVTHLQRKVVFGRIVGTVRDRRAPHLAHRLTFNKALEEMGVMRKDWKQLASVRPTWRKQLNNHGPKYCMGNWLLQRESEREKRHEKEAAKKVDRRSRPHNEEDAEETEEHEETEHGAHPAGSSGLHSSRTCSSRDAMTPSAARLPGPVR